MNKSTEPVPSTGLIWKIINFPLTRIIIALLFIAVAIIGRDILLSSIFKTFSLDNAISMNLVNMILTILAVHFSYLLYVRLIEKRPAVELSKMGFPKELVGGMLIGFGLFTVIIGIIWSLGYYHVSGVNNWVVMIPIFTASVMSGYIEEIVVRGIILRIMEEGIGTWLAVIISATIFGVLHLGNENATVLSALAIASTAGVLLAAVYIITRRLWLAIGLHFAWNFTQGGIFSAAVSGKEEVGLLQSTLNGPEFITGGLFGPEASIITVILGLSLGIYFLFKAYKKNRFIAPFWILDKTVNE